MRRAVRKMVENGGLGLLAMGCCFSAANRGLAGDWPQWRGPARDGISTETIRTNWSSEGLKVQWRANVGTGFCSIAISEGRAYTMGNSNDQDTVWCLDARTGRQIW